MAQYLLDTNICITVRRQRPVQVLERLRALAPGVLAMSVVTYGELRYGLEKSAPGRPSLELLEQLVGLIPVRPMPAAAGEAYGRVRAELERTGCRIGNNDLWIAAHALAEGLTVVTHDTAGFARVSGLLVEDWTASDSGAPRAVS